MATDPKDDRQLKMKGVVARGRTFVMGKDGKTQTFRPGEEVEASAAEIERGRRLGFLVDPSRPSIMIGKGPQFYRTDDAAARADPDPA